MADWYPSAKLRISVRLDESGGFKKLADKAPRKISKNITGINTYRSDLVPVLDERALPVIRYRLLPKNEQKAPAAQSATSSPDGLSFDLTVVPREASWSQNGIKTGNQFEAEIRWIDLPFDPRLIRAAAVSFFLGDVGQANFRAGAGGGLRAPRNFGADLGGGEPLNMIPDEYVDANNVRRTNLRFQGFVDKWGVEFADAEPTVKLECRDSSQLLQEEKAPARHAIDTTKPIDKAVALYLAQYPLFNGLSVEYRPNDQAPPTLQLNKHGAYPLHLGPTPSKMGGAQGDSGGSVWDHLNDVVGCIGLTMWMDGTTLVIQGARSLNTKDVRGRADDPFQSRSLPGGQELKVRRFIYGRNIEELHVARSYTAHSPKNIEVRSYLPGGKKTIVGRFPLKEDRIAHSLPGIAQPDQKWVVYRVSGLTDEKQARLVAQNIYEQVGRNEFNVEIKTKNLGSYGAEGLDPDLLDMRVGDPLEILVNRDEEEQSTMTRLEKVLAMQGPSAAYLQKLGMSREFADAYAKAYSDASFLTIFRTKQIKAQWSVDSGVSLSIVCVNYLEARMDKRLPTGEETGTGAPQKAGKPAKVNDQ